MKFPLYLFAIFFVLTGCSFGQDQTYEEMLKEYYDGFPTIQASVAKQKIDDKNVYFIDTREVDEFTVSHVKGALRVDYNDFDVSAVKHIPKDAEVIVYCSIGARSQTIGKSLKEAGYSKVQNLHGGLFNWANVGFPMVNSIGETTEYIHGYSKSWGKWVTTGKVVY